MKPNISRIERGMIPGSSWIPVDGSVGPPVSVKVLPEAVCPYAKITALKPSIAACTCARPTAV